MSQLLLENKELRELLWINHGHDFHALYGDDGEMQCAECHVDFKRHSPELITQIWKTNYNRKLNQKKENDTSNTPNAGSNQPTTLVNSQD
ncbi:MAG: hypothetical protein HOG49_26990 [Candidatus Scalindua sp.]|nr:hypothetical protein [Candidatus Scalindua sp.]